MDTSAHRGPTPPGPIELLWIPLGTGSPVVRFCGRVYEAIASAARRERRRALYHSALVVTVDGVRTTIEMAPVASGDGSARGAVASGPVGSPLLHRWRVFRYEVRCWADGIIPDAGAAVGGPTPITADEATARRLITLTRSVPTPTWGRDELRCGEMWNSNSVTSWLLARAGVDLAALACPQGGRAPGWQAGVVEAERSVDRTRR